MRLGLLVHTCSCVGHFQQDEAARQYACSSVTEVVIHSHIACPDAQLSAFWQSIARVDHQVQDYLFDLTGICIYVIEIGFQDHCEFDVLLD